MKQTCCINSVTQEWWSSFNPKRKRDERPPEETLRGCQQWQYLLKKLRNILQTFYSSFIESMVTFSITCWFHSISLQNRKRLQSTVWVCSKIIGLSVRTLSHIHHQQTLILAGNIKSPHTSSTQHLSANELLFWHPGRCRVQVHRHPAPAITTPPYWQESFSNYCSVDHCSN